MSKKNRDRKMKALTLGCTTGSTYISCGHSVLTVEHVNGRRLAELRALGEAGQLLAGFLAGYTIEEVAAKREWAPGEAERHLATATAYVEEKEREYLALKNMK